jgi:GNAT superfamily N-acetyltransferase
LGSRRTDAALSDRRRNWPLVIRRARPGDGEAVKRFASGTFRGWDYLPQAWPRWLEPSDGIMLVGTPGAADGASRPVDADGVPLDEDIPVAVVRVALPAWGEAWLEAIRVDPRVRGLDVATDLQVAELHWAAAQGASVVRYATGRRNEASHRLGRRGGFETLVSLESHWWSATGDPDADDGGPSGFLPEVEAAAAAKRDLLLAALAAESIVAPRDTGARMWRRLAADPGVAAAHRLYEPRPWAFEEISEAKFGRHVQRGEVLLLDDSGGWALAILVRRPQPAEDSAFRFALLAGDGRAALELIEAARRLAGETIRFRVAADAALFADNEQAFREAGYVSREWALDILSRQIDAAHPIPPIDLAAVVIADSPEPILRPPD